MCRFQVSSTNPPESIPELNETNSTSANSKPEQERSPTPTLPQPQTQPAKTTCQSQEAPKRRNIPQAFGSPGGQIHKGPTAAGFPHSPQPMRPKAHTIGEGKNCNRWFAWYSVKNIGSQNYTKLAKVVRMSSCS